jgi:hypothetical protein
LWRLPGWGNLKSSGMRSDWFAPAIRGRFAISTPAGGECCSGWSFRNSTGSYAARVDEVVWGRLVGGKALGGRGRPTGAGGGVVAGPAGAWTLSVTERERRRGLGLQGPTGCGPRGRPRVRDLTFVWGGALWSQRIHCKIPCREHNQELLQHAPVPEADCLPRLNLCG